MSVVDLSISKQKELESRTDNVGDQLRDETLEFAKMFKTSWLGLGRHLYAIHQDKLFHGWGFEKFEDYTEKELGLKKTLCLKLLKAYLFLEEDEPEYLSDDFLEDREALKVPNYDQLDVLRLARSKAELLKGDYQKLRAEVFDRGKDAGEVRRELTGMMKERKQVDPEEERDMRNEAAIKKFLNSLKNFTKDMEALKLVPDDVVQDAEQLLERLQKEIG